MKKLLLSTALVAGSYLCANAQALNFDGAYSADDAAEASTILLTGTTNVTMEAWVKSPQPVNTDERLFYNGNSAIDGYGLYLHNGNISLLFGGINIYNTYNGLQPNTWTHVALVNNGTQWIVYVNGQAAFSTTDVPNAPTSVTTIGGRPGASGETFSGTIDELHIWSVGRTSAQILDSMYCTISSPVANLVANYNFNQGTPNGNNAGITTITDISGNGNDMTLDNFALTGNYSNWVDNLNIGNVQVSAYVYAGPRSVPVTGGPVNYTAYDNNGGSNPTYQWYKNGTLLVGETSQTYYDSNITPQDTVRCEIGSSLQCINNPNGSSNSVVVSVYGPAEALNFDGSDDYVSIPFATNIPINDDNYTIEAWINPDGMSDSYGIIGWGNYGTDNQVNALRLTSTGISNYWWNNDLIVNTTELSNTWHHVAATYDGTDRKIYLDGVLVGSDQPGAGVHAVPSTADFNIGLTNPSGSEYFSGIIDEVRIWNVARTATEIMDNMHCTITMQSGLVANYDFNEGLPDDYNVGIDSLWDISGNNNYGNLNNFDISGGSYSNWTSDGHFTATSVVITTTASDTYINSGDTVSFTAVVTFGGSNPIYQWMVNGVNVGTDTNIFVTSTLPLGSNSISCTVTSDIPCVTGSIISEIPLTILPTNCVPYNSGNCYDFGNAEYCNVVEQDNGYYFNNSTNSYGNNLDDASILSTGQDDAYDGLFEVAVNNVAHSQVDGAYYDTLRHYIQSPKQTLGNLVVSQEMQFYTSKTIVRLNAQMVNPTNMPITAHVNIAGNFGSDDQTIVDTTSTGNIALNDSVRWMTTWDQAPFPQNDPVNTSVRYGKGHIQAQPHFKNKPENGDDYYDDGIDVTIPPHSTRYVVMFNRMDSTTDAARANAPFFDDIQMMMNDSMFIGIDSLDNIVNWSFVKPIASFGGMNTGCDSVAVGFNNTSLNADSYSWDFGDGSPVDNSMNPTHMYASGNYTVTLTAYNDDGLDSTIMQGVVAIAPAIDVTTSVSGSTITANNGTAATYQWLDCNSANAAIGGATMQSYTPTMNGNYAVQIVTTDGCVDTSACVAITNIGLKANAANGNVSIYPNPATDKLTIALSSNTEKAVVEVVDVMGRVIYKGSINANENNKTIDLANFGSGVYQLRISNSTGTVYQNKLIKQ